ncbi:MAG: hypothetical protein LBP85_07130 [Prevotellaceae bacterium]|jgi:hypothetical protein|nr:hypothetical protein [Prevotellaceae bacterium]
MNIKIINNITTIAAHELGHGIWALKHTFDNDYGNIAVNTTGNLMDYTPGANHLAKWQWEIIRYPALFTDPFGGDEEGMYAKDFSVFYNDVEFKKDDTIRILKNFHYKIKLETKEKKQNGEWETIKLNWKIKNNENKSDTLLLNVDDLEHSNFLITIQKSKNNIASLFVEFLDFDIEQNIINTLQELLEIDLLFNATVNDINEKIKEFKFDDFLIKGNNDMYVTKGMNKLINDEVEYMETENILFNLIRKLYETDLLIFKYEDNFDKIIEKINTIITKDENNKYVINSDFVQSIILQIKDVQQVNTEKTKQQYKLKIEEATIQNISTNENDNE